MTDISLSSLEYSTRTSSRTHELDHDDQTQSTWIDFDRESTLELLPVSNRSPPVEDREAPFEDEHLENVSSGNFANDTSQLRHRHETLGLKTLAQQGKPNRGISSLTGGFATSGNGWWKQQMMVDRSLRSMAALTSTFALIMGTTCLVYLPKLAQRTNKHSTSVGGSRQSCQSVERKSVAIDLLINIAATMTLGMSNTYQQLITSLKVDELRWMLSKHEDSRVGTNSPMAINHKKNGKVGSLLAWLLLITTSLPLHLLANSVIGPSYSLKPTQDLLYNPVDSAVSSHSSEIGHQSCWIAFRSGSYLFQPGYKETFKTLNITYFSPNCTQYKNSTTDRDTFYSLETDTWDIGDWAIGNCTIHDISCSRSGVESPECRLSVRMSAALTLSACLLIKAVYMIAINISARHKTKTQCLTFGDVLIAFTKEPDLQIHNECLVNAGDGHRHHVQHTCHKKHCSTDSEPSSTGDDIGHCQKCTRFNIVDKAANLPHPCVSAKYKMSLISNLGSTAISQMMILMVCSLVMLSISIMLAVFMASEAADFKERCIDCSELYSDLKASFGTFGGFQGSAYLGSLQPDSLMSEFLTFMISNGAQLIYSLLYLLLIYNITLISMERDWGSFEKQRSRPRCTLVKGDAFDQSYLLQLPKKVLYPMMIFSAIMHWLLGLAISATEMNWEVPEHHFKLHPGDSGAGMVHSIYSIGYGTYSIWLSTILMIAMTTMCWWAFTYKREGFMPQMYGSIRACCAATTELRDFPREGIQWGDLGMGERFRYAGFSGSRVDKIIAGELYCGREYLKTPELHVD